MTLSNMYARYFWIMKIKSYCFTACYFFAKPIGVPYNLIHLNEAYFYFILHTWLCSTLQKCLTIKIDIFCTWYIISSEINTVYPYELEALTRGHIVCFERKLNLELYFKIYDSSFMFFLHYTNHTDWVIWIFCNKYW